MATRQEDIKAGTLEGAADRLAALRQPAEQRDANIEKEKNDVAEARSDAADELELSRDKALRDGLKPTDPPRDYDIQVEEEESDLPDEIEAAPELEPLDEVAPSIEEDDLFADDMDEDVGTHTLDAPAALSKEGKELFAKADPELQKEVEARLKAAERGATQKVQQVAQKEKEVEQLAQEVLQMKSEWEQKLQSLDVQLPEPPDPDLADINSDSYDPDQFNVQLARYERAKLTVESTKAERQRVAEENAVVQGQQRQQELKAHASKIVEYFPRWNTQEKFSAGVKSVQDFLISEGVAQNQARQVTDPDAIKYFYMAKKYMEIKAKARKSKVAPKASAPTGRGRTQQPTNVAKARQALKESGSIDSAVDLLRATTRSTRR